MSATTLIRVKRRRSQSPAEALLVHLATKRARAEEDSNPGAAAVVPKSENRAKIFRFAATLTDTDKASDDKSLCEVVGSKVKLEAKAPKSVRTPIKEKHSARAPSQLAEKSKETVAAARSESRFKVVGTRRNIDVDELDDDNLFHLLDIVQEEVKEEVEAKKPEAEDKISCNGVELEKVEADSGAVGGGEYVYDVYYHRRHPLIKAGEFEFTPDCIDQVEKIDGERADELLQLEMNDFLSYQDDRDFEAFGEDSDSNDENNWRNEYPEDDDDEVCSDDYDEFGFCGGARRGRAALADDDGDSDLDERFGNLGVRGDRRDDDDLSSDDEDELVYSKNFERDANLHGTDYARYKQKILARDYYFEEKSDSESDAEEDAVEF